MAGKGYRVERVMMNKAEEHSIRVVEELQPGEHEIGSCQCFSCIPLCACCLVLPCCVIPESIAGQLRDSRYIYVKETSIEWNDPRAVCLEGGCLCGVDPCNFRVQDDVTVLYYDDPLLNEISDQTRCCNDCRTSCFGGEGDQIQLRNTFCAGCCAKALPPCPCVPAFCPRSWCPCALSYTIDVRRSTGEHAVGVLLKARDEARSAADRIAAQLRQAV